MNRIRTMAIGAAIAVPALVAAPSAWSQATAAHDMTVVQPDAVKWVDAPPLPGAKLAVVQGPLNEAVPFIYRLRFPDNYRVPAHWHPHSETVTVLSGTSRWGMARSSTRRNSPRCPPAAW
jgi:quercetin dioxygenase-like cupin family protein